MKKYIKLNGEIYDEFFENKPPVTRFCNEELIKKGVENVYFGPLVITRNMDPSDGWIESSEEPFTGFLLTRALQPGETNIEVVKYAIEYYRTKKLRSSDKKL